MRPSILVKTLGLAGLLAGLTSSPAPGAIPMTIDYQGRLTTSSGVAVPDGSYTVTISIFDAAVSGAAKWSETQSITTTGGLFALTLGTVSPLSDTVFRGETRYLSVVIGGDTELLPRVALVSVPYAMRVSTVDGASGGAIGGHIRLENSSADGGTIFKAGVPFLHNAGTDNTFLGSNAGNLAQTGAWSNTGCGARALQHNTIGSNNTAVGTGALQENLAGFQNTAVGLTALSRNTSGRDNTACGTDALGNSTTGDYNTAVGSAAAFANLTGAYNTAFGYAALHSNDSGHNNCATGAGALRENTSGNENVGNGLYSLQLNTTGSYNTGCGSRALWYNATGSNNTALGYSANVGYDSLVNATAIGANSIVNASNKIRLGDDNVTVIEGRVPYTYTSDAREKENFEEVDGAAILERVRQLTLSTWNYKQQDPLRFRHYGPVAQEFYAAFGHDRIGQISDSVTINSGDLAGITLIAVQQLEKRTADVERLRTQNTELARRLEALESQVRKLIGGKQ